MKLFKDFPVFRLLYWLSSAALAFWSVITLLLIGRPLVHVIMTGEFAFPIIRYPQKNIITHITSIMIIMAMVAAVMLIIIWLRKLFANLDVGALFDKPNARYIMYIGVAFVSLEALFRLFHFVDYGSLLYRTGGDVFFDTLIGNIIRAKLLLIGLVAFALARVFRHGAVLNEEHELTV